MTDAEQLELRGYRLDALNRYIREISEDAFCAGWHIGIERVLLQIAFGVRPAKVGFITVEPLDVMQLRYLATETASWWHWPENADEPCVIDLEEAKRLYL